MYQLIAIYVTNFKRYYMKQLNDLLFPENLKYSEEHEWAVFNGQTLRVGITDYAQDQLGDIVFVELPQVGDVFTKGAEFGSIESVKAVSELFIPFGGEIVAVNSALEDSPELIADSPYDAGWLIEIIPADKTEFDELLDAATYRKLLKG